MDGEQLDMSTELAGRLTDRFTGEWDHLSEQDQDELWMELVYDARHLTLLQRQGLIARCVETVLAKVILAMDAQQRGGRPRDWWEDSMGRCPACGTSGLVHDPECEWGLASSP